MFRLLPALAFAPHALFLAMLLFVTHPERHAPELSRGVPVTVFHYDLDRLLV